MHPATPTLLIFALWAPVAGAAPVTVCGSGCAYSDLAQALDDPAADPVLLAAGETYPLTTYAHDRDVVIEGPASGVATVLCAGACTDTDGTGAQVVWRQNIHFVADTGSSVHVVENGSLELDGVRFVARAAAPPTRGGAIDVQDTHLVIRDSHFEANQAAQDGGHLHVKAGSTVEIENSTFEGGQAVDGASIWIRLSSLDVTGTTSFTNNQSSDSGGVVYCSLDCDLSFQGTSFVQSRASGNGGVVWQNSLGSLAFDGVLVNDAVADGSQGGGVAWLSDVPQVTLRDSDFVGGSAAAGGGFYLAEVGGYVYFEVNGGRFEGNTADDGGGAIYFEPPSSNPDLIIDGTRFVGNDGDGDGDTVGRGGAIYLDSGNLDVRFARFEGNTAQTGGAVYLFGLDSVLLADTRFVGNMAHDAGALRVRSTLLDAHRNLFCENAATLPPFDGQQFGGAVMQIFDAGSWSNNAWVRNSAVNLGGAWYANDTAASHRFSAFVGNAANGGSAIYQVSGFLDVDHVLFYDQASEILQAGGTLVPNVDFIGRWNSGAVGVVTGANELADEPTFVTPASADCDTIDLWPDGPAAPQIDAGDAGEPDPDGSPADLGISGGPLAEAARLDIDGDGWTPAGGDCDDADVLAYPGAPEDCGAADRDCDGDSTAGATDAPTWYADDDVDGFGDPADETTACTQPTGTVANNSDCDDTTDAVGPGHPEICDSLDNDCDGTVDNDASDAPTWFRDADGDGFGDVDHAGLAACERPGGHVGDQTDCDDATTAVNPDHPELCDGLDNDCSGTADPDDALDAPSWYTDGDGDGFGAGVPHVSCAGDVGDVDNDQDCDDGEAAVYPGAPEVCDELDNDCNGRADEDPTTWTTWYTDADQDGFGVGPGEDACFGDGRATVGGDCDDSRADVNPDAVEVVGDGVDNDCGGGEPTDGDGDGFHHPDWGGNDCDDADASVHPWAEEIPGDGIDQDCDGFDDVDADGDGHLASDDCDDADASVFPGADEPVGSGVDRDCDGVWVTTVVGGSGCGCTSAGGNGGPWPAVVGMLLVCTLLGRRRSRTKIGGRHHRSPSTVRPCSPCSCS